MACNRIRGQGSATDEEETMSVPPIKISFMLACYAYPEPADILGITQWNSMAGCETRKWLQDNGLVNGEYRITEKGEAWVKFICETPLPVMRYSLPDRPREEPKP
jgi:hypothetical protein